MRRRRNPTTGLCGQPTPSRRLQPGPRWETPAHRPAVANQVINRSRLLGGGQRFLFLGDDRAGQGQLGIDFFVAYLTIVQNVVTISKRPEVQTQNVIRQRQGIAEAEISSPVELSAAQKKRLAQTLERLTGKKIQAKYSLDPALLGGAVVRVGDTIYDGSVRNSLNEMRARLAAE